MPYVQSVYDQQVALNKLGAGLKTDGIMGPLTQAAITKYGSTTNQDTYLQNLANRNPELADRTMDSLGYTTTPTTLTQGQTYMGGIVNYDAQTGARLATGAKTTIPTSTLGSQTPYKIPTAPPSNTADIAMAGATAASAQMTTEQKALAAKATADQTSYDKLSGEISSLLGTATGQGAAQLSAEKAAGVPQMQQQLQGINSQITTKLAEFKVLQDKYAETQQVVEGRTIPMDLITGKTAELNRSLALQKNTFASEIGLLQAQAQGVQGNLELAKSTADRAVDLKYEDIRFQIQVKMQQLDLIRDSLTASERKQAAALDSQYQSAQNNLSIQVANEKDMNSTLLSAMQKYPDANILLTDTIEQANAKIVANSAIYAKGVGTSSGGLMEISAGASLYDPATGGFVATAPKSYAPSTSTSTVKAPTTYKVTSQDSGGFYSIAQKLGVTQAALMAVNPSVDPNNMQVGQVINLPTKSTSSSTSSGSGTLDYSSL